MLFPMIFAVAAAVPRVSMEDARPDLAGILTQYPLRKGARWTFEGEAEWSVPGGRRSGRVRNVMEVLDVVRKGDSFAAIVRGFPLELAWYRPGMKPGLTVLIGRNGRIYERDAPSLRAAQSEAQARLEDAAPPEEDPILDLPLRERKAWGREAKRGDGLYCWVVEDGPAKRFSAPGVARGAVFQAWSASFRTNPDHLTVEFAPGVGITGFTYEHHGTVARTRLRLVAHSPN